MQPLAASAAKALPVAFRKRRRSAIMPKLRDFADEALLPYLPQPIFARPPTSVLSSKASPETYTELAPVEGHIRERRPRAAESLEIGRMRALVEDVGNLGEDLDFPSCNRKRVSDEQVELGIGTGELVEDIVARGRERFRLVIEGQR